MVTAIGYVLPDAVEGHHVASVTPLVPYRPLQPDTTIMWLEGPSLPSNAQAPNVPLGYVAGMQFARKSAHGSIPLVFPAEPVDFVLRESLRYVREAVLPAFEPFFEG